MTDIPTRDTFASMYADKAPWDIGKPQEMFVAVADQVHGDVLDAGCGTGENALYFAQRGHAVVGIDFLEFPVQQARIKAAERGLRVEFQQLDALTLATFSRQFDSIIDCGLFHCFADTDRERYVAGLAHVAKPGARLYLACFSDKEPGEIGPRRISEKELRDAFRAGWTIESLQGAAFETIPSMQHAFSPGGAKAWFAVIRRAG